MTTNCANPYTHSTGQQLLAELAHSDLSDGECVIKLNGHWIVCGIQRMQVTTGIGAYTEVELTGIVK